MDVKYIPYQEAKQRINDKSTGNLWGDLPAENKIWVVILFADWINFPPPPVTQTTFIGRCAYTFVDPETGSAFQSGFLDDCRWCALGLIFIYGLP